MCDLPEYEPRVQHYVNRVAFESVSCDAGLLAFTISARSVMNTSVYSASMRLQIHSAKMVRYRAPILQAIQV